MKSPKDASVKLEGDRHKSGMKINSSLVQVRVHRLGYTD
jgi:hypothetical protein